MKRNNYHTKNLFKLLHSNRNLNPHLPKLNNCCLTNKLYLWCSSNSNSNNNSISNSNNSNNNNNNHYNNSYSSSSNNSSNSSGRNINYKQKVLPRCRMTIMRKTNLDFCSIRVCKIIRALLKTLPIQAVYSKLRILVQWQLLTLGWIITVVLIIITIITIITIIISIIMELYPIITLIAYLIIAICTMAHFLDKSTKPNL